MPESRSKYKRYALNSYGRESTRGKVVFAAGEGLGGLPLRVKAWKRVHTFEGVAGIHFAKRGVDLLDKKDVESFILSVKQFRPVLIVIDTLARAMHGGNEDSAQDMGLLVAAAEKIIEETGAAVLLIHHTVKSSNKNERGSGALRAAADSVWRAERVRNTTGVILKCEKQKDAELTADIPLHVDVVHLDTDCSSCVITDGSAVEIGDGGAGIAEKELRALRFLVGRPNHEARFAEWSKGNHGLSESTFNRCRKSLTDAGLVELVSRVGGPPMYRVTEAGLAVTSKPLSRQFHDSAPQPLPPLSPPFRGEVAVGSEGLDRLGTDPLDDNPKKIHRRVGNRRP